MPTPHNSALKGEIAKVVLMPGDPARANMIATTYLDDVKVVSSVRNNCCYTGTYHGKPVSVMASGMGMPSLGIYAYELFHEYDVDTIIRIGTAGSYVKDLQVRDIFIADNAFSESSFAKTMSDCDDHITSASPAIVDLLKETAAEKEIPVQTGTIHSSDVFYRVTGAGYRDEIINVHGCKCVEMESFALFHIADQLGKNAGCLCTISDSFVDPKELTPEERQNTLHSMIQLALDAVTK